MNRATSTGSALQPPEPGRPGAASCHVGVLVPWANSVVEAELPRWGGSALIWHYARLMPLSGATALDEQFLTGLLDAVPSAVAQLAALPLRRVYLACTSAAFMFPRQAKAAASEAPVPVITAFDAIIAELRLRQAHRIVLLTPYPDAVSAAEAAMFSEHGIIVTGWATLNLRDGYPAISPAEILGLARKAGDRAIAGAQAIVLSCTGWPTFGLEDALKQELGREMISSNLAIAAHAVRTAGDVG
jgi:maleate isomerase